MKYLRIGLVCFCLILLCSCGKTKEKQKEEKLNSDEIYCYYVNQEMTNVVRQKLKIKESLTVEEKVNKILEALVQEGSQDNSQTPIPNDWSLKKVEFDEGQNEVSLHYAISYEEMTADQLLMAKVCIVNTILQLKEVHFVTISLTDVMNSNAETATVTEQYDADSFVMSFNKKNYQAQKGHIVLYFANEAGDALKEYNKSIEISNNMSLAEIVMESLIEGPSQEGYQATIPDNTTVGNILIKDGICYVDLSDEFYETDYAMKNDLIVYSIVNSLAELPTVSKVQFLKNGEKQEFYRESMPFDALFERNLDIIEQEKKNTDETEE